MDKQLTSIIKAIFESRYLKRIKRSGTQTFLGSEIVESVPEHSFYTSLWAIVFCHFDPSLNGEKLLKMCLTHDLEEVRTGDLNQINRVYQSYDPELKAFSDMWEGSKFGKELIRIHRERIEKKSVEAIAARDCDTLAELVTEKEYLSLGKKEAAEWMEFTVRRLKTKLGKRFAKAIIKTRFSSWWEDIKNEIRKAHKLPPKDYSK